MHIDSKEIFMLREYIHRSCDRRAVTEKVICMRAREPVDIFLSLSYPVFSIKYLRWRDCDEQSVNLSEFPYWNTNCLQWPVRDGQGKWFTHLFSVEGRSDKMQKMWGLRLVLLRVLRDWHIHEMLLFHLPPGNSDRLCAAVLKSLYQGKSSNIGRGVQGDWRVSVLGEVQNLTNVTLSRML